MGWYCNYSKNGAAAFIDIVDGKWKLQVTVLANFKYMTRTMLDTYPF